MEHGHYDGTRRVCVRYAILIARRLVVVLVISGEKVTEVMDRATGRTMRGNSGRLLSVRAAVMGQIGKLNVIWWKVSNTTLQEDASEYRSPATQLRRPGRLVGLSLSSLSDD